MTDTQVDAEAVIDALREQISDLSFRLALAQAQLAKRRKE